MSLDLAALASFRAALVEEEASLRREIAAEGGSPESRDLGVEMERGFADSAHVTAERAQRIAVIERLRSNLRDVERALEKIERGTFGLCERCGRDIGRERLEALPSARLVHRLQAAVGLSG